MDLMARRRVMLACAGRRPPAGYQLVTYAYNTGPTLINTGFYPDVDDYEFDVTVRPQAGSLYLLQSRITGIYGISGSTNGNTIIANWSSKTVTSTITRSNNHLLRIRMSAKNGVLTLTVEDLVSGAADNKSGQYSFAPLSAPICVFGNTTGNRIAANTRLYAARIRRGGVTVLDYAPCVYNGITGFWDYAARRFVTPDEGTLAPGG